MDPPEISIIYTIGGVLDSRIGGSVFWILPAIWGAFVRILAGHEGEETGNLLRRHRPDTICSSAP